MSIFFNVLLGIILGLDAFSLALSLGSFNITIKKSRVLIVLIGIFHFVFPILGAMLGSLIHIPITELKILVYFFLMIEMSVDYFSDNKHVIIDNMFNYLALSFSVSIDSFSIGISLLLNYSIIASSLIFSLCAVLFTIMGIILGNKLNKSIGKYANIIGLLLIMVVLICQIMSS